MTRPRNRTTSILKERDLERKGTTMTLSRHGQLTVAACLVAFGGVASVFAQPAQMTRQRAPMYDTKTEARFTGTVEAVETVAGPARSGRRGTGGIHVTLKTATETLEVHLGPSAFMTDKKIDIVKGDTVEILGSRVTIDNEPVLLAREIKKGDHTWTLRDASGRPLWSRGRP